MKTYFTLAVICLGFYSCKNLSEETPTSQSVILKIKYYGEVNSLLASEVPHSILVDVTDTEGTGILIEKRLKVYKDGEDFKSSSIQLPTGDYILKSFRIINDANDVIYVPSKKQNGSPRLYNSVPQSFTVHDDQPTIIRQRYVKFIKPIKVPNED